MNLFAYGTLMDEEIMARVCGCRPGRQTATLFDHRRHALVDKSYPAIVPLEGARVEGVCYLDLPEAAWEPLDYFEDELYKRKEILVTMGDGSIRPAETYLLRPEFHSTLEQGDWDYDEFIRSHKIQFEQEYCGFENMIDSD